MRRNLKFKAVSIVLASMLFIVAAGYLHLNRYFMKNLLEQEHVSVEEEVRETEELFAQFLANLGTIVMDWGPRDETYNFIEDLNEEYIINNLNPQTLSNLHVNAVILFDEKQKIKYAIGNKGIDANEELPAGFLGYLQQNSSTICTGAETHLPLTGILKGPKGPMLFGAAPIQDSTFGLEQRGTLVFARYVDEDIISETEKIIDAEIQVLDFPALKASGGYETFVDNIEGARKAGDIYVRAVGKEEVDGYSVFQDFKGDPLFLLRIRTDRTIFNIGKDSATFFVFLSAIMVTIIFLLCLFVLQKLIIAPIIRLREDIKELDLDNLSFKGISCEGKDEICDLTREINKMLSRIEVDNKDILENQKQLQQVMEGARVGLWDYNVPSQIIYLSRNVGTLLGFSNFIKTRITVEEYQQQVFPEDMEQFKKDFQASNSGTQEVITHELRIRHDPEGYKWISIRGNVVERDEEGQPLRISGIVMDIDERKSAEEALKNLTHFDRLTGLYHRGYFEYLLETKIANGEFPFAMIIGDVNGLKAINDTFGHSAGDAILVAVAGVLKNVCGENSLICRWGGDEFAIIVPDANVSMAEEICLRISIYCFGLDIQALPLNMSLGYSLVTAENNDFQEITKQAEERMFRNKLFDDSSARSGIVSSLQRALEEKSYETEEHVQRIGDNCLKMGKKLRLNAAKLDELLLLALMHDIGKIAIPDSILEKSEPLDYDEWEIMKSHSEIGYRIAAATPELSHIADGILAHHEHYDGSGYPNGLRGNEIMLISRILSIIDSYDVMTNERAYKKAMTKEEAVEELKKCSGAQFDPELVEIFVSILDEEQGDSTGEVEAG